MRIKWFKEWMELSSSEDFETLIRMITGVTAIPAREKIKVDLK